MEQFSCIAHVDNYIEELAAMPDLSQPIGYWTSGEPVFVRGLFTGRTTNPYFGKPQAVRWECPTVKGMFGKGLACYMRKLPIWAAQLPKAK